MSPYVLPDDTCVYAVGDIHGEARLLERLLAHIRADADTRPARRRVLVFVGDYVDRGPDSRGVLERLAAGPPQGFEQVCLLGNHEEMMLGCLDGGPRASLTWLANGGQATCRSYGLDPAGPPETLARRLREHLPPGHERLLRELALHHREGGYLFVHAGIRPGVPLAEQRREDLVWIRRPFHESQADHGCIVVHGHAPVPAPEVLPNRIAIDTGAVYGNRLTAVALQGAGRRFLQVPAGR